MKTTLMNDFSKEAKTGERHSRVRFIVRKEGRDTPYYYDDDHKTKGLLVPDEKKSEETRKQEQKKALDKPSLIPLDEEAEKNKSGKGLLVPAEGELAVGW